MLPTYRDGDRLLVPWRPGQAVGNGHVVVADPPSTWLARSIGEARDLGVPEVRTGQVVKRVAAVSGDPDRVPYEGNRVPIGKLLLRGDDPAVSADSRRYGPLDADRIVDVVTRPIPTAHEDRPPTRRPGSVERVEADRKRFASG